MTAIIGAGLSGLIAATQFPNAQVYEARNRDSVAHKALLRFRSDALSRLTGIPFRKVTVRKSVWYDGAHQPTSIMMANLYSRKTNGMMLDRSIWNLDPVERFIAPEDLIEQMVTAIGPRIEWKCPMTGQDLLFLAKDEPVISTIPMPVINKMLFPNDVVERTHSWADSGQHCRNCGSTDRNSRCGKTVEPHIAPEFNYQSVVVDRYRVSGADVHQTIYFPSPDTSVYRASITGDLLIVERSGELTAELPDDVLESFGIQWVDVTIIEESHHQRFGKITPIDEKWRKQFIFNLTARQGIYSMGRFAVWRNILLDDAINDGAVIKRLINTGSYGAALQHSRSAT